MSEQFSISACLASVLSVFILACCHHIVGERQEKMKGGWMLNWKKSSRLIEKSRVKSPQDRNNRKEGRENEERENR